MIINIPIEPIPMRYSCDWDIWFKDEFKKEGQEFITIYGNSIVKGIEQGRFLDCIGTNFYKSSQLLKIISMIQNNQIKSGDVLFFHDLWFPGIEQIKYTSDLLDLDLKITGCLHAGAYDPNDFLYQKGLGSWAIHFEHMLFSITDLIFVATKYHKDLLKKSRSFDYSKIKVSGFPIFATRVLFDNEWSEKEDIVVFPHRRDPEKNPQMFDDLQFFLPLNQHHWSFLSTQLSTKTKEEYYSLLEKSKIAVSFSDQETWGIAMQEAVFAGCLPLVPDKLSYSEMYLNCFKYTTYGDFTRKLQMLIEHPEMYKKFLREQQQDLLNDGVTAIPCMVFEINKLLEG